MVNFIYFLSFLAFVVHTWINVWTNMETNLTFMDVVEEDRSDKFPFLLKIVSSDILNSTVLAENGYGYETPLWNFILGKTDQGKFIGWAGKMRTVAGD